MTFLTVSETEWKLSRGIGAARRRRLLETSFDTIVQQVTAQAQLRSYGRHQIKEYPGSKRVQFELVLPSLTVDLFHNAAGGYRAQYYIGIQQGEEANRHIIACLLEKIKRLCSEEIKRSRRWEFIEASLRDPDAKLWIHQGTWMRYRKIADRNLEVEAWMRNGNTQNLRNRLIPVWAQLTPACETRLELKGGCVDDNLRSVGAQLKPFRSMELHELGYT